MPPEHQKIEWRLPSPNLEPPRGSEKLVAELAGV